MFSLLLLIIWGVYVITVFLILNSSFSCKVLSFIISFLGNVFITMFLNLNLRFFLLLLDLLLIVFKKFMTTIVLNLNIGFSFIVLSFSVSLLGNVFDYCFS